MNSGYGGDNVYVMGRCESDDPRQIEQTVVIHKLRNFDLVVEVATEVQAGPRSHAQTHDDPATFSFKEDEIERRKNAAASSPRADRKITFHT